MAVDQQEERSPEGRQKGEQEVKRPGPAAGGDNQQKDGGWFHAAAFRKAT
jgi:hypothetical protein